MNTVSIVIEWENAILSEADRSRRLLRALRQQAASVPEAVELLIMHDPVEVPADGLSAFVEKELGPPRRAGGVLAWRLEPAEGLHYYELKNEGARRVGGDWLVFVDSDVIPQEGWLNALLQPMRDDPRVELVMGNTWIDPEGLTGQAFAAGWFFGPPSRLMPQLPPDPGWLFANNLAFRRTRFLASPFPAMPDGCTRGACTRLLRTYRAEGVPMRWQMAAECSHPAPNGIRHVTLRGLAEGRDQYVEKRCAHGGVASCLRLGRYVALRLRQAFDRTTSRRMREHLHLNPLGILPCLGLVGGYYGLFLLGGGLAACAPRWASRQWRI